MTFGRSGTRLLAIVTSLVVSIGSSRGADRLHEPESFDNNSSQHDSISFVRFTPGPELRPPVAATPPDETTVPPAPSQPSVTPELPPLPAPPAEPTLAPEPPAANGSSESADLMPPEIGIAPIPDPNFSKPAPPERIDNGSSPPEPSASPDAAPDSPDAAPEESPQPDLQATEEQPGEQPGAPCYLPETELMRFDRQLRFAGPLPDSITTRHRPTKIEWDSLDSTPSAPPAVDPGALTAVFDTPAEFPRPGFTSLGGVFAKSGAVIYEGMTVSAEPSGRYEVRYVVESPKTPVILRLQLVVHQSGRPVGTLTLPPVTIVQDDESLPQEPSVAYLVRQKGFSHQLHRMLSTDPSGQTTSIVRAGTARYGGVPK